MNTKVLRYIGKEKGILPDVPARDLDYKEVRKFGGYGFLISTGLYEPIEQTEQKRLRRGRRIDVVEEEKERE